MRHLHITTQLPNGTPILIRDVRPGDGPLLRLGFDHLSADSRYFRFLGQVEQLSDAQIASFTAENDADHIAIGALAGADHPIAIARHIRLPSRPDRAEFALTVIDACHGQGVGSLLFGILATCVRAEGITAFDGLVHRDNTAMRKLISGLGGTERCQSQTEIEASIPLHADPSAYPATRAGDAMRRASRLCERRL